jgi:hypothetical protein
VPATHALAAVTRPPPPAPLPPWLSLDECTGAAASLLMHHHWHSHAPLARCRLQPPAALAVGHHCPSCTPSTRCRWHMVWAPPPRDRSPPPVIDSSSPMPLPPTLWPPLLQLCTTAVRASSDRHSSDWSPPAAVGAWRRRVRGKFPLCRQSLCSGGQSWLSTNKLILAITERNNYAQCLCDLISDIVFR